MLDISVEKNVKLLQAAGFSFSKEQLCILKEYYELRKNRFECGDMFELEDDFMCIETKYTSLAELAEKTCKLASDHNEKYGGM